MSEDQFNQVMAKLTLINNIATEANSIARGTAIQMSIMFNGNGKIE